MNSFAFQQIFFCGIFLFAVFIGKAAQTWQKIQTVPKSNHEKQVSVTLEPPALLSSPCFQLPEYSRNNLHACACLDVRVFLKLNISQSAFLIRAYRCINSLSVIFHSVDVL